MSDGRDDRGWFRPCFTKQKSEALDYPLIQHNGPRRLAYIAIDVDRPDAAYAWRDEGKPEPNIVIVNPTSGRGHLLYELDKPVWKAKPNEHRGEARPLRYYRAVRRALTRDLGGDASYANVLVKNPLSEKWRVQVVRQDPYSLGELAEYLDLSTPQADLIEDPAGRNCTLFESIRHWARHVVRGFDRIEDFRSAMLDQLETLNLEFPDPLPERELRDICKSVSRYTWARRPMSRSEVLKRQSLSAMKTARVRSDATLDRLVAARRSLEATGTPATNEMVAELAGVSGRTVRRYRDRLLGRFSGSVAGRIPDTDTECPPPSTTVETTKPAAMSIFDPKPPENDNLPDDHEDEVPAPRSTLRAADIVSIIRASRTAPTYDDLLAQRGGNRIRVIIDVIGHAKAGRLVSGLPPDLYQTAHRNLSRMAA